MQTTQQMNITLPAEMAQAVREKVAAGKYASESEVIRDGLLALADRDSIMEPWLNHDVAAAYDALRADPGRAVSIAHVRATLADAHNA